MIWMAVQLAESLVEVSRSVLSVPMLNWSMMLYGFSANFLESIPIKFKSFSSTVLQVLETLDLYPLSMYCMMKV